MRETVGVGHLPSIDDLGRVRHAVAQGGATSVVDGLTDGLESQLGKSFDGAELSHGQWQKLALARGHMPLDPLLVVLNEPTAAHGHLLTDRVASHSSSRTGSRRCAWPIQLLC